MARALGFSGQIPAPGIAEGAAATVCLRPKEIRLFTPAAGDRTGKVVSGQCLGDAVLVHLALAGLEQPLRVLVPPEGAPAPGQTVGYAAENVMVFPGS